MFNNDKKIRPVLFDNLDGIFDERGSTFCSMRLVQWCGEDEEPNREKAKLELRKWRVTTDGQERADKGLSFLTENGPHELTKVLIDHGYGNTKDILLSLKKREDFNESVEHLFDKEELSTDGEYFDMRSALLADIGDDSDDE